MSFSVQISSDYHIVFKVVVFYDLYDNQCNSL